MFPSYRNQSVDLLSKNIKHKHLPFMGKHLLFFHLLQVVSDLSFCGLIKILKLTNHFIFRISRKRICDVLRNLVPFVQFKKRGKHPWRMFSVGVFTFFKLYKWYQIAQCMTYYFCWTFIQAVWSSWKLKWNKNKTI